MDATADVGSNVDVDAEDWHDTEDKWETDVEIDSMGEPEWMLMGSVFARGCTVYVAGTRFGRRGRVHGTDETRRPRAVPVRA